MIVTYTDDQTGFGNAYGASGLVPGFSTQIASVPTNTQGDVSITLEYFGDFDFGGTSEFLTVSIEGTSFGPYTGQQYDGAFGAAEPITLTLSIDQATWASIIADGVIDISYDIGTGFNNLSDAPSAEEFIKLTFAWDFDNMVRGSAGSDILRGTDFDDVLRGHAGNDKLKGFAGDDILRSMGGNDRLWGGTGADTFIFSSFGGKDRIFDFETGIDTIDVSRWKGIDDFADLKKHAMDKNGDLWIINGKDVLIINDFTKAELDSGDFAFAL